MRLFLTFVYVILFFAAAGFALSGLADTLNGMGSIPPWIQWGIAVSLAVVAVFFIALERILHRLEEASAPQSEEPRKPPQRLSRSDEPRPARTPRRPA